MATHITLQDGCFGIATLIRIAALFVPSHAPTTESEEALPPPAAPRQPVNPASAPAANVDVEGEASVGLPAVEELRSAAGWDEGLPEGSNQAISAYASWIIVIIFVIINVVASAISLSRSQRHDASHSSNLLILLVIDLP